MTALAAEGAAINRSTGGTPVVAFRFATLLREFFAGLGLLWRDRAARFSLLGTSVFWGT